MTAKPLVNVSFTQILAVIGILMVGFIGGIFVNSVTNLVRPPLKVSEVNSDQKIEAESARYTGLAEFYKADRADEQQTRETEAARYSGLATYYGAENQRAIEAEADRYNGLATYYGAANQRAIEAETARYSGLATLENK